MQKKITPDDIAPLKQFIKSKNFNNFILKFLDIKLDGKYIVIESMLTNKHKVNFYLDRNSGDIFINMYGRNKLPLKYENKIRHKFSDIVYSCLEIIHNASKADTHLYLLKFYYEAVRYLSNPHNGYDINFQLELDLKVDIHGLFYKLDGFGKTSAYQQLVIEYHDVTF